MRPWPKALRDLFPLDRARLPERPWWVRDFKVESDHRYVRNDCIGIRGEDAVEVAADLIRHDKNSPLPKPPYRPLQVWADHRGSAVVILNVDPHGSDLLVAGYRSMGPNMSSAGICPFTPEEYPFLVADPLCPSAAPWAPVETT